MTAAMVALLGSAVIVLRAGLVLSADNPGGTLATIDARTGWHLAELAIDVIGWMCLLGAGLLVAAHGAVALRTGSPAARTLGGGLLAAAGLAGVLHDAGNLALTQLAGGPATAEVLVAARALTLLASWGVNLAGLLWLAATVAFVALGRLQQMLRLWGWVALLGSAVAAALPWLAGGQTPSEATESVGYALQLPLMVWYVALALTRTDVPVQPAGLLALGGAKHLLLTSFRRDGSPVSTAVWSVPDGDRLLVLTDVRSGKVARIRHTARVLAAPCTARGTAVTGHPEIEALAQVLDDDATVHRTRARLREKYGLEFHLGRGLRRLRGQSFSRAVVLALTVPASGPAAPAQQETSGSPAR